MRIILVPDNTGKRFNTSLTHRQVLLIGLLFVVVLPVALGIAAFRVSAAFDDVERREAAAARYAQMQLAESGIQTVRAGHYSPGQDHTRIAGLRVPAPVAQPASTAGSGGQRATQGRPDMGEIARMAMDVREPGSMEAIDKSEPLPLTSVDLREVQNLRQRLREHRDTIAETQRTARHHLDAMALRLGHVQAQLARVDALGLRLTEMAGLDRDEFDFGRAPALGGPEGASSPLQDSASVDLNRVLEDLSEEIEARYAQLEILESLLMDHEMQKALYPGGWPLQGGWISSRYGYRTDPFTGRRTFHAGVDIANKPGTPIKSMAAGVVKFSGVRAGYGLLVEINHGNGYTTRYAHALATLVKTGQRVERGQTIAVVGTSGRSTGPHLHFEVVRNGRTVDPMKYLQANR